MNRTLEQLFRDFQGNSTWVQKCVSKIFEAAQQGDALGGILAGLVGRDGATGVVQEPGWKREDIWGINIELCHHYCSREHFPMVFNYEVFLGRTTNYLLPWLALTAQLPYEAGDIIPNLMSFLMALGSPMLLTFSLMMTIFNSRWLRSRCKRLNSQFPNSPLATRLNNAATFLVAAQQVPLRMIPGDGWLASLILLDSNATWWSRLATRLGATRRRPTLSLVAQMLVAVTAWILTIVGSFGSSLGDHAEGLTLSSSTLWTWLVPLIPGWITVGTQARADDISEVLIDDQADRAPSKAGDPFFKGNQGSFGVADLADSRDLSLFGFSIHGDEIKPGPVYNYARIYTWRHAAQRLLSAFEAAASKLQQNQTLSGNLSPTALTLADIQADRSLSTKKLSNYCGLLTPASGSPPNYNHTSHINNNNNHNHQPPSSHLDADFRWQVLGAAVTAAVVQWGTTSPAIIIAYLTDVRGLGCRSGGYLMYGVLSTGAFLCYLLSVVCSRQALLRVQERDPKQGTRMGPAFYVFGGLSVALRALARVVVVGNAAWLVVSSLFELVGFFDNCWCEGVVFAWGDRAWVTLFKNAVDLAERASGPWAGSVAMSSCVMMLSYIWFALLCRKPG
ncbi:hypothetical protein VTK26DRAFT_7005 [Humicola hyalothermophila]